MTANVLIGSLAYAVTAAALLVRDILWLRVLGLAANLGFVVFNITAQGGPTFVFLGWSLLFLVINLFQIGNLILERRSIRLPEADEDLHTSVFPSLPVGEFRILLKASSRRDLSEGTVLAEQGGESEQVLLIERGAIKLERDGELLDQLIQGHMLGEIAFVARRPFSSRATVVTPTRVLSWDRKTLERLFLRRPALAIGFHAAFIGQLRLVTSAAAAAAPAAQRGSGGPAPSDL
jgi:Cyclic nucleotide-binding domain